MRKPLMAGVSAFAHLLGMSAAKGARAEDDDDKRDDEARAEDGDDGGDGDDEDPPKDAKKSKKAKAKAKAEDDDDDEDAKAEDGDGDDDGEDPPKDAKKSKKAKAKAEDDDEDGDDDDDSEQAKGAKAERARWTRVLSSSAAAGGRIAAACELLSGTNLKASAVISTLNALPASPAKGGLGERMAGVRTPNVGGDGGGGRLDPKSPEGKAAAIVAAGKKRRGEL